MTAKPLVSVVISVHQGERFVRAAAMSVLSQTLDALELIIVDDASTDGTAQVLASLTDPRLRVVTLASNQGPAAAANRGLEVARGSFIARLDADDLCEPDRLTTQLKWLDAHPDVGLLGSACLRIDEAGGILGLQSVPTSDLAIRLRSLLVPAFVHSSVLWRSALGFRYDESFRVGCDYELWSRALHRTKAHNLEQPLIRYRVWAGGITATRGQQQRDAHDQISWAFTRTAWPELAQSRAAHRQLRRWTTRTNPDEAIPPAALQWLAQLQRTCLGVTPAPESIDGFARALFTPAASFGQPLGHAS